MTTCCYPDYLRSTVAVLESYPNVGVVHTGFDVIDLAGDAMELSKLLVRTSEMLAIETGREFIERSMRQDWMICSPSALFRTEHFEAVGGFPADEEALADVPMLRRIALDWDIACISRPLVAFRVHDGTASATLGALRAGLCRARVVPADHVRSRIRFFLNRSEAATTSSSDLHNRFRSIAEASLRRDRHA